MDQTTGGIDPQLFQAIIMITIATLPIKGLALWKASHRERKGWFAALLIFNTLGLLDIIYYFFLDLGKPKKITKPAKNSSKS